MVTEVLSLIIGYVFHIESMYIHLGIAVVMEITLDHDIFKHPFQICIYGISSGNVLNVAHVCDFFEKINVDA